MILFFYNFILTFFIVLAINLIGEKLINNNTLTKIVFLKNLAVCICISLLITFFYYIQPFSKNMISG